MREHEAGARGLTVGQLRNGQRLLPGSRPADPPPAGHHLRSGQQGQMAERKSIAGQTLAEFFLHTGGLLKTLKGPQITIATLLKVFDQPAGFEPRKHLNDMNEMQMTQISM